MHQLCESFDALSTLHGPPKRLDKAARLMNRLIQGHFITQYGVMRSYERADRQVRPGDVVCLVKGSVLPIILRPEGRLEHYTFVSICLMHCEPPCVLVDITTYKPQGRCRLSYVV